MNILFLTLGRITDINNRGIYTDLMRKFRDKGHKVTIVSPEERRFEQKTRLIQQNGITILRVRTLNIQKTNVIEKGIGTILLEYQFLRAIKKYLGTVHFDLILYSTPPITLTSVIQSVKKRTGAKTYLLLKDIFPQNAVDIRMFGEKSLIYKFFRRKEKNLYAISDYIGCMSPANVEFLLQHNPEVSAEKVEVNPNSIELTGRYISDIEKVDVRQKYSIQVESTVFIYGGNLGKPQGLNFLPEVIQANSQKSDVFFLIVGTGTEFNKLDSWFKNQQPANARLIPGLPKEDYDKLVQACDVGLIFLDPRFTIPNFPSRLLSYLEYQMPVIAATDPVTDVGKIAESNGFGFSVLNGDLDAMGRAIDKLSQDKEIRTRMGTNGFDFLNNNYLVRHSYEILARHFQ